MNLSFDSSAFFITPDRLRNLSGCRGFVLSIINSLSPANDPQARNSPKLLSLLSSNHPFVPFIRSMKKKSQLALRHSLEERRQYLKQQLSCRSNRMGEVVGGTTAEVAAVCFCFPCSLVDFAVLTMYKVPKGLCKNALRSKRERERRLMMQWCRSSRSELSVEEDDLSTHPAVVAVEERFSKQEVEKDVKAMENEMWEKFSESGFWRSPSKRMKKMEENIYMSNANSPHDTRSIES